MSSKIDQNKTNTSIKNDKPYLGIQRKIWLVFIFIYTPISLLTLFGYYYYAFQTSLNMLTTDLSQAIEGAVQSIDAENFKLLYQEESENNPHCPPREGASINGYYPEDNPRFQSHMDWLKTVLYYESDISAYTYVKGPNPGDVIVISSSWYFREPHDGFKFCQLYNSHGQSQIYEGLSRRVDVWRIYTDSYGSWITSYMPIKDKNGEIVGAIGMDLPANAVIQIKQRLQLVALLSFSATYLVMLIIIVWLTNTVSKPIQKMALLTRQIGGYDSSIKFSEIQRSGWQKDEIDILIVSMQAMLDRIANQTLELTKSREQMRNLTRTTLREQEEERRYISRELHDDAGHLLINLRNLIEAILTDLKPADSAQTDSSPEQSGMHAKLATALKQIDQTLNTIRALSHQMRTPLLDVGDLNLALQELCDDFKQSKKIKIIREGELPANPSEEVAVSLYRFLQEALTNVLKHASASEVRVSMQEADGWITLSVADNGRGLAGNTSKSGIGLVGMKERFHLLGGIVEASSDPNGFLITVRVPMAP